MSIPPSRRFGGVLAEVLRMTNYIFTIAQQFFFSHNAGRKILISMVFEENYLFKYCCLCFCFNTTPGETVQWVNWRIFIPNSENTGRGSGRLPPGICRYSLLIADCCRAWFWQLYGPVIIHDFIRNNRCLFVVHHFYTYFYVSYRKNNPQTTQPPPRKYNGGPLTVICSLGTNKIAAMHTSVQWAETLCPLHLHYTDPAGWLIYSHIYLAFSNQDRFCFRLIST